MEHIRIGRDVDKATILTGGKRWGTTGYFIQPTIFTNCSPSQSPRFHFPSQRVLPRPSMIAID